MNYSFIEPWDLFLPREGGHVIGLTGAGDKAAVRGAFAARLVADGIPVALAATCAGEPVPGVAAHDPAALAGADLPDLIEVRPNNGDGALTPGAVDALGGSLPNRVVLAGVDGNREHPLQIPAPGEPAWPSRTSLAVIVLGADAVGSRLDGVVGGWPARARGALAGLPGHTLVTWELVEELLLGEDGYLAQVPQNVPVVLALTQLGEQDDSIGLFGFVDKAMAAPRLPLVLFCGTGDAEPVYRTAARAEPHGA